MSPTLDTAQQLHLRSLLEVGLPLHSQPVALRSLLQFLLAYAQLACLPAGLCYWLWYRR